MDRAPDWIQQRSYLLGTASLGLLALAGYLALVWSPPDVNQGEAMRIFYVHVPTVMIAVSKTRDANS